jgi:hypothetical protein
MDERELERIAGQLGRRAADRLDVEAVARDVVARLRADDRAPVPASRPRPVVRWLATAAAVALVVAGSVVTFKSGQPATDRTASLSVGLQDLSSTELTEVLDSLGVAAPVSSQFTGGLDDLDAEQLRELLALMEG